MFVTHNVHHLCIFDNFTTLFDAQQGTVSSSSCDCIQRLYGKVTFMAALDPSFSLFQLPQEYLDMRSAIRDIAEARIAPYAAEVDENERFPQEALDALIETGFNAIHVPEAYGGAGADSLMSCIVIEEVARVCGSSSLIPAVNKLGTMGLILAGSEELKKQVLPDLVEGKMASYALSERGAGSDAAAMKTRAKSDGDDWVLDGTKCWITNGGKSTWYTVMAVTDPDAGARGISAFMVHADDEGFTVGSKEKKLGIKGSPTAELHFENCRIPGDRIIGEPGTGFKTALATLDHTRPTIGAQALGIAQGAFDVAVKYVKEREQFGRPISDFQNTQFMLADMKMKLDAARLMVYTAASNAERGEAEGGAKLGMMAAGAKTFASDAAMQITVDAVQLLGGYGYTRDFPLERMMRDAKITQIYEGTNQICRMVMGRQILG